MRQRLEELVRSYGVEIVGEVWRALDGFCRRGEIEAKKVGEGQESYCAKLNDLFLVVVFTTVGDTRKIITLFPTNRRATLERFC